MDKETPQERKLRCLQRAREATIFARAAACPQTRKRHLEIASEWFELALSAEASPSSEPAAN